jgi:type IV pilus biogenesis protein PilP
MYIHNFKLFVLGILMIASVCNAQIASALPPTTEPVMTNSAAMSSKSSASAVELQTINENMTVLAARLAQLELQAKIAAKQKEITGIVTPVNATSLGGSWGAPSVVSVAGLKGNLEALLVFPGGVVQRVRTGDVLGDRHVLHVLKVSINEVVIGDQKGKNLQRLAFGISGSSPVSKDVSLSPMPSQFGGIPAGPTFTPFTPAQFNR